MQDVPGSTNNETVIDGGEVVHELEPPPAEIVLTSADIRELGLEEAPADYGPADDEEGEGVSST